MGTMGRAGCPIHQKRTVRRKGLAVIDPCQRLFHHVFGEVILRIVVRWFYGVVILIKPRLPLRGLAGEETVEVIEAVTVRPAILGADVRGFRGGRVVPLAEGGGGVAVVLEHLGDGGGLLRHDSGEAVEGDRALGDGAGADTGVVASGQDGRAGRRADGGGVEGVVAKALIGELAQRGRVDLAAERVRDTEADVIEQHDEDIRRVLGQALRRRGPFHRGVLEARLHHALHRRPGKRQHGAVIGSGGEGRCGEQAEGGDDGLCFHEMTGCWLFFKLKVRSSSAGIS